jgi:hypothetical protein
VTKSFRQSIWSYLASDNGYKLVGRRLRKFLGYFGRLGNAIDYYRNEKLAEAKADIQPEKYRIDDVILQGILSNMIVRNGPFAGMKYPEITALSGHYIRGPIAAKMVGCYERELHPVLNEILRRDYSEIVNVGSAEGYYTIGLALKFPNARNVAFDIDPLAQTLCTEIAKLNGVESSVEVKSFCSSETLKTFSFKRGLVLSDCEGFEQDLFTESSIANLKNCDVLIELHDFADPNIYSVMHERFKHTHRERLIGSWSDSEKIRRFEFAGLTGLNPTTIRRIVDEHRPHQEWMFLEPLSEATA